MTDPVIETPDAPTPPTPEANSIPDDLTLQQVFTELQNALGIIVSKMIDENVTAAAPLFEKEKINQGDFVIDLLAAHTASTIHTFFQADAAAALLNFHNKVDAFSKQITGEATASGIIAPEKKIII